MKTAEEKATKFLTYFVGTWNAKQERELVKLIKEQDRDTRHACAEAIAFVDDNEEHDVVLGNAIRACMNTKNV